MSHGNGKKRHIVAFIFFEESGLLVLGTVGALMFANYNYHLHHEFVSPYEFFVNDILMALFFFIAAKEIREALLPGGPLHNFRAAAMPLFATLGGIVGPALLFIGMASMFAPHLTRAWAVPTATDIAFSYLVARFILGKNHPAIPFLLLLAVADDGIGLVILAIAYPTKALEPLQLGWAIAACALALTMWKRWRLKGFAWYLGLPGLMSWYGFHEAGIHPALALVPLAWCMPHAKSDVGMFMEHKGEFKDALNVAEDWLRTPVACILGLFGFVNAGVRLEDVGAGTWIVMTALVIGKPIGIYLFARAGSLFGLRLPNGMGWSELMVTGMIAGVGFTVALFVAGLAIPPGSDQIAMKVGALLSFASAAVAAITARWLGVKRVV